MLKFVIWGIGLLTVVAAVDRVLLWLESLGWINYSRNKLSRGGAMYHTLELHSVFDPGMQEVMEVKYAEQQEEDESGAPPCQERGGELADGEAVKARPPES
jgi:hypothetical protein